MSSDSWTIRRMLAWMTEDFGSLGVHSPRLDGELLLAHALGVDRVTLYMDLDRPMTKTELADVRALVVRRRKFEPLAYILGKREFYMRAFEVNSAVLIPRPETEVLVDLALETLPKGQPARVLDLCTGSGAIAITIAAERAEVQVEASDFSAAALEVAARNRTTHDLDGRVQLREGDLYGALDQGAVYDLILCNPPYVTEAEMLSLPADVRDHEPRLALAAGGDGLDLLRRVINGAPTWLAEGGVLLMEFGASQGEAVRGLAEATSAFQEVRIASDLAGLDRVLKATLK